MSYHASLFRQGKDMMTPISIKPTASSLCISSQEQQRNLRQESLREQMEVMFWQECSQYKTKDYLIDCLDSCGNALPEREGVMSEQWRTRMCEWAYQCKLLSKPGVHSLVVAEAVEGISCQ